ncbi:MAG: hypothetical protein ABI618_10850 [Nitrospirota bacterium]
MILLLVFGGCIGSDRPMGIPFNGKRLFEVEIKKYRNLPPQKSMALAGDRMGVYASGYSYDLPTKEVAIQEALRYCRMRREDLGVEGQCRTYAIGDEIVEDQTHIE